MSGFWLASYVVLWVLVVLSVFVLMTLARQIGIIYERLGSTGARAMDAGPMIGEIAPAFKQIDIFGQLIEVPSSTGKLTLLFFTSTHCSICSTLMPSLKSIADSERDSLEVVLINADGSTEKEARKFAQMNKTSNIPFVVSQELGLEYRVTIAPYVIVVDKDRKVVTKGLVNDVSQLESILNAVDSGHSTLEGFMESRSPGPIRDLAH